MIRLRTLGSVDLRAADGSQIQSVLRQPKRLALLIHLALGTGRCGDAPVYYRRDRLLALFWPESDEEKARGSLSQAVFQLRAALGRDTIVSRGDEEIGIAAGALWADACEFEEHCRAGRPEDAMALYHGELLPGFLVDDAPEFDRWLDERRSRVATCAATACASLASQAERAGKLALAVEWARRAISIQPFNEPAHQRLIALLDHSGDRAAALRAYEELRELLRTELDAEPSAETMELVRAVRARAEAKSNSYQVSIPALRAAALAPQKLRESRRLTLAVLSGLAIVSALVWGAMTVRKPEAYRPPADHVAVLFFNDESANKELGYLADGLTSTLIDQLGQVRKLNVISQNGVRPFRGHTIPLDSVSRQLDVGTIVGGSVTRSNDLIRVTVELVDGPSGMVKRSKKLERPVGELFALLDDVSSEVSAFLRSSLGEEIRLRERQAETRNVEAWQLYQRAEFLRSSADSLENSSNYAAAKRELLLADSMAERAIRIDDEWVAPVLLRGEIARRIAWMSLMSDRPPKHASWLTAAEAYADAALRLQPQSAGALELRGNIRFLAALLQLPGHSFQSRLMSAEEDVRAALAITPDLPSAQSDLSAVLFVQGRFEEARRAGRLALEADAYLTDADEIANRLFIASFEVGDDVDAGHWCDDVRRRQANRWPAAHCDLIMLGWSSSGRPDPRKALLILENSGASDPAPVRAGMRPRLTALTAAVLARAGEPDSARAMLKHARALAPADIELLPIEAAVRVLLSERSEALQLLETYLQKNPSAKPRIANGRMYRPLREEPRFRAATSAIQVTGRK